MKQMVPLAAHSESQGEPLIVIVDDDDLTRKSTRRLLSSAGFRSEAFASAEGFVQSGRVEVAACLLLDVSMPGMSGLELQRQLIKAGQQVPIIFISARASDEDERHALEAGAISFLRKPTNKEALMLALDRALDT